MDEVAVERARRLALALGIDLWVTPGGKILQRVEDAEERLASVRVRPPAGAKPTPHGGAEVGAKK